MMMIGYDYVDEVHLIVILLTGLTVVIKLESVGCATSLLKTCIVKINSSF